jgi:histidyl-tRNA synthetase
MKAIIQSVKGTREFYPREMAVRTWLYDQIRAVSESYGYQEYDGPFLEKIDLYAAKSGEELVKEQAFVFPDRGGDLITLRPELTPSLARLVAQRQGELVYPLRWWSFGPFWRYERPQKGRTREFFQWNIDLIGANAPETDAELISICAAFFKKVGLSPKQVQILVNDRRLMDGEFIRIGITPEQKVTAMHLIDRRDKMSPAAWDEYALNGGISAESLAALKALLDDRELWKKSEDMRRLFAALDALGVMEYISFDPQIVRGLDYYTGTVFEARDMDREGRAILGGGHYDNLVGDVGGDPLPGVGFAMGDVMMTLVLEKYGCLPEYSPSTAPVLVTVFDEALLPKSFALAASLREAGIKTLCYPEPAKMNKQLKYADRMAVRMAVIIGPDEDAAGQVTVKDLAAHTQQTVALKNAPEVIGQMLAGNFAL